MRMTATARPVDGTLRHQVDVNGRHVIVTDECPILTAVGIRASISHEPKVQLT
jgi:hypothetical protein